MTALYKSTYLLTYLLTCHVLMSMWNTSSVVWRTFITAGLTPRVLNAPLCCFTILNTQHTTLSAAAETPPQLTPPVETVTPVPCTPECSSHPSTLITPKCACHTWLLITREYDHHSWMLITPKCACHTWLYLSMLISALVTLECTRHMWLCLSHLSVLVTSEWPHFVRHTRV